jgi:inosine/xanthosine triphosphatase
MKKIVVASLNPVKRQAVENGFRRMLLEMDFDILTVSVDSGVPDQPRTDQESRQGALNRARNARMKIPQADFWVGLEGGIDYLNGDMIAFAWIVVLSESKMGSSRTGVFRLPAVVQSLVEEGMELGDADDHVFGRENSKQQSGAVGLLTGDVVTRTTLYAQAVVLALIPFKNPELYQAASS